MTMQGTFITVSKDELQSIIRNEVEFLITELKTELLESKIKDGLSVKEASEIIGLKAPTIYQYASENKIPHRKIGRRLIFSRKELLKWLEAGRPNIVKEAERIIYKNTHQGSNLKMGI